MSAAIDQARALLAVIGTPTSEHYDSAVPAHAINLASELILCGEWRLASELCDAALQRPLTPTEKLEIQLNKVDCLIKFGGLAEALQVLDSLETTSRQTPVPARLEHWAVILRGRVLWRSLRLDEARTILTLRRAQLLAEPDSRLLGWCSLVLSNIAWSEGKFLEARKFTIEAFASSFRNEDPRLETLACHSAGMIDRFLCHWSEAREHLRRAIELGERRGHIDHIENAKRSLAIVEWKRGRLSLAREIALGCIKAATASGAEMSRCLALEVAAWTDLHAGELECAEQHMKAVISSPRRLESSRVFILADEILGDIALERNCVGAAAEYFEAALTSALALVPRGDIVAELRRRRAECFYLLDRHDEAYAEAKLGLEHTRELGDRYEEAATYRVAALAAAALNKPEEAKQLFEQGFTLFEDIETPYEWGKLWMAFGDWLASDKAGAYHDPRLALEAYHAAHYRFDTMGAKAKLAEVNARIARASSPAPESATATSDAQIQRPTRTPPRPRPSRSRELDRKTEWARENFGVITANHAILETLEIVQKIARSKAAVLVLGESGTGKELIAHALHKHSGRKGEFMAINCATLPKDVIESELFGHVAGAFTGASREKVGLLEVCEGGTVFLDEVSEMSLELQSRLLRFLESGEIRRVGATRVTKLSTRIVAASNREEADLRSGKGFRADLYYRLAHTVVKLPPLRLRGARDIELLADHYLAQSCAEEDKSLTLSDGAIKKLALYAWPGNVRELRSTMQQRAVLTADGQEILADDLRLEADAAVTPASLEEELAQTERRRIEEALKMSQNSKADAARLLGMPRTTLINRMQRLGIEGA